MVTVGGSPIAICSLCPIEYSIQILVRNVNNNNNMNNNSIKLTGAYDRWAKLNRK